MSFARIRLDSFNFSTNYTDKWSSIKNYTSTILDEHTDIISSTGILCITTCFLAAKVFEKTPPLLPRVAKVVYDFGGIVWLNVQIKDFFKECKDFKSLIYRRDWSMLVPTAAKVFVKGVNILFTVTIFTGSVIAACGYPQLTISMALSMRSLSLASYFVNIGNDIYDFAKNTSLIRELNQCDEASGNKVKEIFMKAITSDKSLVPTHTSEDILAHALIQQLDFFTIGVLKAESPQMITNDILVKSLVNKNTDTTANLGLIVCGRIAMGVSKAYPETIADMTSRFLMSALFTCKLVRHKLFLYNQQKTRTA